jgi:hypothetical protein
MKRFVLQLLLFLPGCCYSQVVKEVVLDSVVIQAVKRGFNVDDFIEMVKSDTSFARGFRNLRNMQHEVTGNMAIYNKKKKVQATRYKRALQVTRGKRKWIEIQEEKVTGKFYDRKENPETYTAELFDEIFFYKDTLAVLPPEISQTEVIGSQNTGNIGKLKKLVFSPGTEIEGVPIVGKRMAIFDDDMVPYYDYSISVQPFTDSLSCYVFTCTARPGAGDYPVVRSLHTWFDRKTFNIVYRDYTLKYSGLLFDFDVDMKVTMAYENETLYPSKIEYSGFWDVPMHKEERANFDLIFRLK